LSSSFRLLALAAVAAGAAAAGEYAIRPAPDSRFALEVYKTGLMSGKKHLIVFDKYEGTLAYDAARPEDSKVDLTIQSRNLEVKDDWLGDKNRKRVAEEALKQLDAAHHPEIRFTSSAVAKRADGAFDVQGTLTIRGEGRPVTVRVSLDPAESGALKFTGTAQVKLKDYGLKPPTATLGVIGTKNEMKVDFTLTAVERALRSAERQ
jgi:polyisoprenoid-binding protein YceI